MYRFKGIIPAFPTPLNDDNTIREDVTRQLLQKLLAEGANGFYVCGGTGEGLVLQKKSRMEICEIAIDEVKGRQPIIVHIAAIDFKTTIELAKHAEKAGADCIASVPPFYFVYDESDILDYYARLAAAVSIPVMIYYLPAGGVSMNEKLVSQIFKIDNVTSVKWSSNNYYEMEKLRDLTNGEINIINGSDETLICGLAAGADAGIGATYCLMLKEYLKLYDAFIKGDHQTANSLQLKINRVTDIIIKNKVIPSVKFALESQGIMAGNATFPMHRFTKIEREALENELKSANWPFA